MLPLAQDKSDAHPWYDSPLAEFFPVISPHPFARVVVRKARSMSVERVAALIATHDRDHTIAFQARLQRRSDLASELDEFVESLSTGDRTTFQGIGEAWREIDPGMAAVILRRILEFNLAYSSREIDEMNALKICGSFLNLFRADARFFTNGSFSHHGWSGRGRVAKATFETGVIGIDSTNIGILWCHDED